MSDLPIPRQNTKEQSWVSSRFPQLAPEAGRLCPQAERTPLRATGYCLQVTTFENPFSLRLEGYLLVSKRCVKH